MSGLVILSIIQGITEFLPISSSAHLIIVSKYFSFSNANLTLDMSLHFGSLLAIFFYFKEDLINFVDNKELFKKIIITSIPTSIVGIILIKLDYTDFFRNFKIIGWSTIIFGIILFFSDLKKTNNNILNNFNNKNVLIIGLLQILSLIPGVSRSGIIITGARFLNFNRVDAAKLSFLTSIPILILVSIFNFHKLIVQNNFDISLYNIIGVSLSFIFSYLTIKFFLNFLKHFSLIFFVLYRIFLGLIVLFYVY